MDPEAGTFTGAHFPLREADKSLIMCDAFVTTRQESVYAAVTQAPEMHGPPGTTRLIGSARESVRRVASLKPELAVTVHGRAMQGPQMRVAFEKLVEEFDAIAVPER